MNKLTNIAKTLKSKIEFYQRVYRHPKTPLISKIFLWLAIGYFFLPFDLIPDFIPIIGHLDDMIIIPAFILLALFFVPKNVMEDCQRD